MTIKILDCTLRDGGYYNEWEFGGDLVDDYLAVMAACDVDYVELGLRQLSNDSYRGAHAYTSSAYLSRLNLPSGPTYGCMMDARPALASTLSPKKYVDQLFLNADEERIRLVRVAAHFDDVEFCLPILERLKEKGYEVGLNIMQASLRSSDQLEKLSALISNWSCIDVVYFADSLGSMLPKDIDTVYRAIRKNWSKDIGFHSHNNLGKAIANVDTAIALGCSWIDGTITGMGRGAGNAETEFLLLDPRIAGELADQTALHKLISTHFTGLKKQYGWGVSVPYYIGALNGLHPSYVQDLCADSTVDPSKIPAIITDLGKLPKPEAFDRSVLDTVKSKTQFSQQMIDGQAFPAFMEHKEVVLVAQTEITLKYQNALEDYCSAKKPILISINQPRSHANYDLVVVSHNEKFRDDEEDYENNRYEYVAPKDMFQDIDLNIAYDYGIELTPGVFNNCGSFARVPNRLTLAYAISFCIDAGAKNINLVGFGGYDLQDQRHKEMQEFLKVLATHTDIKLNSLTPTTFTIPEQSIHAI